jgi:hypothetical protein
MYSSRMIALSPSLFGALFTMILGMAVFLPVVGPLGYRRRADQGIKGD